MISSTGVLVERELRKLLGDLEYTWVNGLVEAWKRNGNFSMEAVERRNKLSRSIVPINRRNKFLVLDTTKFSPSTLSICQRHTFWTYCFMFDHDQPLSPDTEASLFQSSSVPYW